MQTRRLGRTNHESSVAILGGAVFYKDTPETAEEKFQQAIASGINHIDIAPGYGQAERALGPHIKPMRDQLFIAGKTAEVTADKAWPRLEKTLHRLCVSKLDLYQIHGVTSEDVVDERDETFRMIIEARDQGLTRYVGVTGHDLGAPRAHLKALLRYDLDTVMFPVYPKVWANPEYRRDAEALIAECKKRDVGVMAIKAVARRPWGDREVDTSSWYEPFRDEANVARGVHFALSTPGVHAFCTSSSADVFPLGIGAAENLRPLSEAERERAMEDMESEGDIFPLREHAVGFIRRP